MGCSGGDEFFRCSCTIQVLILCWSVDALFRCLCNVRVFMQHLGHCVLFGFYAIIGCYPMFES